MLNGWIRPTDLFLLAEKVRKGYLVRIIKRLSPIKPHRIRAAWTPQQTVSRFWLDIPYVARRNNRLLSGDPAVDIYSHVNTRFLAGRCGLTALSLCCGDGTNEIAWARTGAFSRIDAFDLTPGCISAAQAKISGTPLQEILHFQARDVWKIDASVHSYDIVFSLSALHHISPLEEYLRKIKSWLKKDGLLVVWDFCGPSRFQWPDRQIEAVNDALATLPPGFRRQWGSGTLKQRIYRPSKLLMYLNDPSEAVESASIRPLLEKHFTIAEQRLLKANILQLALDDIAFNFLNDDRETFACLDALFAMEDDLVDAQGLASDYLYGVYR
jgi:SAM-dependent methyltransferase